MTEAKCHSKDIPQAIIYPGRQRGIFGRKNPSSGHKRSVEYIPAEKIG